MELTDGVVVICLKICTFVVSKTTLFTIFTSARML